MINKASDKNVANIEDDVELVKRYLENSSYKESESDFFKNGGWEMVDLEIPKAMANILAEREQMLKAINTVEKEKADWIKAYQEEKDSQFELLKRIQELEKERDHWHGCFIVAMENGIAKEKVKNVLKNNRNEIFSATYLSREQFRPYEMQIERINKIEQELIGEDK